MQVPWYAGHGTLQVGHGMWTVFGCLRWGFMNNSCSRSGIFLTIDRCSRAQPDHRRPVHGGWPGAVVPNIMINSHDYKPDARNFTGTVRSSRTMRGDTERRVEAEAPILGTSGRETLDVPSLRPRRTCDNPSGPTMYQCTCHMHISTKSSANACRPRLIQTHAANTQCHHLARRCVPVFWEISGNLHGAW